MSIEYTIDIQLTELGFPEVVPNSPGRETGSEKQNVQPRDGAAESPGVTAALPSESVRDEQGKGGTRGRTLSAGTLRTPGPTTGRREDGDDDSDDSDVSDVCEEEEVDDNEDEDGSHNGTVQILLQTASHQPHHVTLCKPASPDRPQPSQGAPLHRV